MERLTPLNHTHYHHRVENIEGGIYRGNEQERDNCIGQILNQTIVQSMISQVSSDGLDGKKFDYTITRIEGKATILVRGDKNNGKHINLNDHVITLLMPQKGCPSSQSSSTDQQKIREAAEQISNMAEKLLSKIHLLSHLPNPTLNMSATNPSSTASTEWNTVSETSSDSDLPEPYYSESEIPSQTQKITISTQTTQNDTQAKTIQSLLAAKDLLEAKLKAATADQDTLAQTINDLQDQNNELHTSHAEQMAQINKAHLDKLHAAEQHHQEEVQRLHGDLLETDMRLKDARDQLNATLEKQRTEIESLSAENATLREEKESIEEAYTAVQSEQTDTKLALKNALTAQKAAEDNIALINAQQAPLRKALVEAQQKNDRLMGKVKNQAAVIKLREAEIKSLTDAKNRLVSTLRFL